MLRSKSLLFVLCFLFVNQAFAGIAVKSEYSYDQQGVLSFVGGEEIVGSLQRTVNLPNAIYKFDIQSDSNNVYELKSKARLEVNIDGRGVNGFSGDGWARTRARAFSSTQLVDTAFVEGLDGHVGGFVEFLWDVTGGSTISVDPKLRSDAYRINELYTTAFFNTLDENAVPELLLNDQSQPSLGTSSVDSNVGGFVAPVSIFVDWLVGEELDVFFELQTSAVVSVDNFDAAGFEALVDADFSNTAVLEQIRIYDEDGNLIPNAFLRGEEDFIYDPAGLGLGMVGGAMGGGGMTGGGMGGAGMTGGGNPNVVPEPSTVAIWLGLLGLIASRETRRKA